MSKRNENMKVSNMKSDLGGILMRMRHSNFISNKQVNKSSGRRLGYPLAHPRTLNQVQSRNRAKEKAEVFLLLSPLHKPFPA